MLECLYGPDLSTKTKYDCSSIFSNEDFHVTNSQGFAITLHVAEDSMLVTIAYIGRRVVMNTPLGEPSTCPTNPPCGELYMRRRLTLHRTEKGSWLSHCLWKCCFLLVYLNSLLVTEERWTPENRNTELSEHQRVLLYFLL
ncbi:hypothetical protein HanIR_Chr14g0685621 [Helianthus annuus]|nr:hypothetical protein HanIR_Chr14g0685621 [Helianthus annuus]